MARPIEFVTPQVEAPIEVTDRAIARISQLRASEPDPTGLSFRVSVLGGGCSGFQYKFGFDGSKGPDDIAIERDGVTVLVDKVSAGYMGGSVIDFVTELMGSSFQVRNPQAASSCGCGTSFSLQQA
ncbi:MAG: iron-sulfur cluster insertion protein ErpA [Alphaproteobacteria bacterium]|nr:iron-sulfur cluster insertion protein ErpA [Alphaproteobacteria bacterium]